MIEDIYLVPAEGDFAVADIERFVEALPHTFRDASNEHVFLLSPNDDIADYNRRKNAEDADAYPSSATIIKVYPARIDVSWKRRPLDQARTFIRWMSEHYKLRIEDAEDNDLTAACTGDLEILFGKRAS
jgi:hypothetical protein